MKIAFFNCLMRSVPPRKSGGIEKVMDYLVRGALQKGHQVTLFSTQNSTIENVKLICAPTDGLEYEEISDNLKDHKNINLTNLLGSMLVDRKDEYDVIHNHCLETGLPTLAQLGDNAVSTIHEFLDQNAVQRLQPFKNKKYVSISYSQRSFFPDLGYVANIYHGIDVKNFSTISNPADYLLFVGRISSQKRPDLAIEVAARLQKKLLLVGNYKDQSQESEYYNSVFLPTLKKHSHYVEWIGELTESQVLDVMNKAYVTLMPVGFPEPFGLAAVESMGVGCPVIAFKTGAYTETIENGKTGFLVENIDEMVEKVKEIDTIDRNYCRQYVLHNFSVETMVSQYLNLYESIAEKRTIVKPHRSWAARLSQSLSAH